MPALHELDADGLDAVVVRMLCRGLTLAQARAEGIVVDADDELVWRSLIADANRAITAGAEIDIGRSV